jgi:catechol 2,3-dioxygenase-like lactoylglutathione lyase family enzyme
VLAYFIVSDDIERSRRFYTEVLGGRVAFSGPGGLTYVALSTCWIIINTGGGPTDDKPAVIREPGSLRPRPRLRRLSTGRADTARQAARTGLRCVTGKKLLRTPDRRVGTAEEPPKGAA